MIADPTCGAVSFLAARVKSLRFSAAAGHKARRAVVHRASCCGASEQTVSGGS
jgi:hypothetical protein